MEKNFKLKSTDTVLFMTERLFFIWYVDVYCSFALTVNNMRQNLDKLLQFSHFDDRSVDHKGKV